MLFPLSFPSTSPVPKDAHVFFFFFFGYLKKKLKLGPKMPCLQMGYGSCITHKRPEESGLLLELLFSMKDKSQKSTITSPVNRHMGYSAGCSRCCSVRECKMNQNPKFGPVAVLVF